MEFTLNLTVEVKLDDQPENKPDAPPGPQIDKKDKKEKAQKIKSHFEEKVKEKNKKIGDDWNVDSVDIVYVEPENVTTTEASKTTTSKYPTTKDLPSTTASTEASTTVTVATKPTTTEATTTTTTTSATTAATSTPKPTTSTSTTTKPTTTTTTTTRATTTTTPTTTATIETTTLSTTTTTKATTTTKVITTVSVSTPVPAGCSLIQFDQGCDGLAFECDGTPKFLTCDMNDVIDLTKFTDIVKSLMDDDAKLKARLCSLPRNKELGENDVPLDGCLPGKSYLTYDCPENINLIGTRYLENYGYTAQCCKDLEYFSTTAKKCESCPSGNSNHCTS